MGLLSGVVLLERLLSDFPFVSNPLFVEGGVKKSVNDFSRLEIKVVDDVPYLLIPNPSWSFDDSRLGLAAWIDGEVSVDDGLFSGGIGHLGVFKESVGDVVIMPLSDNYYGLICELSDNGGVVNFSDANDVGMIVNVINNFQFQLINDINLLPINNLIIDAFNMLGVNTGFIKRSITNSLVNGVNFFIDNYVKHSNVPIELIVNNLFELNDLDSDSLSDVLFKDDSFVQSVYAYLFKSGVFDFAHNLSDLFGVKPSGSVIQSYYESLFNDYYALLFEDYNDKLHDLFEWSGVAPDFSVIDVQSVYAFLLNNGRISSARDLSDLFGVKPSGSVIQHAYDSLFNRGYVRSAHSLFEWSGVAPDFSVINVQSVYSSLFSNGMIGSARDLFEWSGVAPDFSVINVQSVYDSLLNTSLFSDCKTGFARDLFEWSGVKPSGSVIQHAYNSLFNTSYLFEDSIKRAHDLFDLFGVIPDSSIIQHAYDFLFYNGRIGSARDLFEWFGVAPDFSVIDVQSVYSSLFNNGMIGSARELYVFINDVKSSNNLIKKDVIN